MLIFDYCGIINRRQFMTIEEVFDEYRDISINSQEEKNRIMKKYRKDLIAAGMTEEEADDSVMNQAIL